MNFICIVRVEIRRRGKFVLVFSMSVPKSTGRFLVVDPVVVIVVLVVA